jgi:hypothetical protein
MTKKEYENLMVAIEQLEYIARDVINLTKIPMDEFVMETDDIYIDLDIVIHDFYRIMKNYSHLEDEENETNI